VQTFINGEPLSECIGIFKNPSAPAAMEIAGMKGFQHKHERKFLHAADLFSE
jgi:hypothetical protein